MKGIDLVARILKQEGTEWMACFPANALIEAAAKQSIRPIIFRTERAGIHAADGYSRLMNGKKFGFPVTSTSNARRSSIRMRTIPALTTW